MPEVTAKLLLDQYEKTHPKILEKAFSYFEERDYKNFSLEEAEFNLYGIQHTYHTASEIYDSELLRTYTLWQYDKVEFEISEDYLNNINYTDEIIKRKIIRQPFKSYYVRLNGLPIKGFFIATRYHFNIVDVDEYNNNEIFLSLVVNSSKGFFHWNFCIDLTSSNTLEKVIKNGYYTITKTDPISNKLNNEAFDLLVESAKFAINIVYHISDINANRPEVFSKHQKTCPNNKVNPTTNKTIEYSRKFILSVKQSSDNTEELNTEENDVDNKKSFTSKSPHVRSGHWHHYWIGARNSPERRRIVKWLESTTVNTKQRDNLPIVNIKV